MVRENHAASYPCSFHAPPGGKMLQDLPPPMITSTLTRELSFRMVPSQFQPTMVALHLADGPGQWAWPSPCSAYETPAVLEELGSSTTLDMPDDVASLFLKPENNVYLNHFCLFLMTAFLNCYLAIHAQIFHFIQEFIKCSVYAKYHGCPSLCIQTGEKGKILSFQLHARWWYS